MEKRIDELVNRYSENADKFLGFLQSVVSKISDGKLPESGSSEAYAALLNQLEESYGAVEEYAYHILNSEEMPEKGASVADYRNAVLDSESLQLQEQIKKYISRLEAFLNVTSNNQAFADVLMPYQQDTQRLIQQLESAEYFDPADMDRLLQEIEGPDSFLQALTFSDFETEQSMNVLEKVFENYPSRKIQMGISTGKYYLKTQSEQETVELDAAAAESIEQIDEPKIPVDDEPDVPSVETVPEPEEIPDFLKPKTYAETLLFDEPTVIINRPVFEERDRFIEKAEEAEDQPSVEEAAEPEDTMTLTDSENPEEEENEEIPRFCIHCGTRIEPMYKFCIGCGSPIADSILSASAASEEEMSEVVPEDKEYNDYSNNDHTETAFVPNNNDYLHMDEFIIDEKVTSAYFENSYKIYDMNGNVIGAAKQESISGTAKASRFLFGKGTTQLQKFDLVLLDANGGRVGEIARNGGALGDINIDDANGRRLLSTKLRLGAMKDSSDNVICKFGVAGISKRTLKDANGNLLAEIDQKWNGIKSIFTTADKYYVRISPDLTGELRQIIVSAVIAYDLLAGEH